MKKITDLFNEQKRTYSCEFFTPKTELGWKNLHTNAAELFSKIAPDFFSVTYGAGGSTRDNTTRLVSELYDKFQFPIMHHLTCIGNSKEEIKEILNDLQKRKINNVLALRGDPPAGETSWQPHPNGFHYASELCALLKEPEYDFACGVAGFPEVHPESRSLESDIIHLKEKIEAGGEFIITQLFFDNESYFRYRDAVQKAGISVRIIPGILPITNYPNLLKFTANCGAKVPQKVHDIFETLAEDEQATKQAGVDFAVTQCNELLAEGAPGIHFYTVNRAESVVKIMAQINR